MRPCLGRRLDGDRPVDAQSAPLAMQARLWYGSVAKGEWIVDSTLPARTILVGRQRQRKLEARSTDDVHGVWSFEIIRTWERPKSARLDVYLTPLLETAAGGQRGTEKLHELILELQKSEASKFLAMSDKQLGKAVQRQAVAHTCWRTKRATAARQACSSSSTRASTHSRNRTCSSSLRGSKRTRCRRSRRGSSHCPTRTHSWATQTSHALSSRARCVSSSTASSYHDQRSLEATTRSKFLSTVSLPSMSTPQMSTSSRA